MKGNSVQNAVGALMMFFVTFFAYSPLALEIDANRVNATTTNAVWVLLDTIFPMFWTLFVASWLILAIYFVLREA